MRASYLRDKFLMFNHLNYTILIILAKKQIPHDFTRRKSGL